VSGALPVYELNKGGGITFAVAGSNIINGGQVVEIDTANAGCVKAAVNAGGLNGGSIYAIGVALNDAVGPSVSQNSNDPLGNNILALSQYPNVVTVAVFGVFLLTSGSGAISYGSMVTTCGATPAGQIKAYTHGSTSPEELIGRCIDSSFTGTGTTGKVLVGVGLGI
jgi:hypothetical protein